MGHRLAAKGRKKGATKRIEYSVKFLPFSLRPSGAVVIGSDPAHGLRRDRSGFYAGRQAERTAHRLPTAHNAYLA